MFLHNTDGHLDLLSRKTDYLNRLMLSLDGAWNGSRSLLERCWKVSKSISLLILIQHRQYQPEASLSSAAACPCLAPEEDCDQC